MKRFLAACALMALCAAPASAQLALHTPVLVNPNGAVSVKAGETFFIALPSNVTTGYAWTATLSDRVVTYEGNVYQPPAAQTAPRAGEGGQQLFIFHANRSGSTTIAFAYAQPFDTNAAPTKTASFVITVD